MDGLILNFTPVFRPSSLVGELDNTVVTLKRQPQILREGSRERVQDLLPFPNPCLELSLARHTGSSHCTVDLHLR